MRGIRHRSPDVCAITTYCTRQKKRQRDPPKLLQHVQCIGDPTKPPPQKPREHRGITRSMRPRAPNALNAPATRTAKPGLDPVRSKTMSPTVSASTATFTALHIPSANGGHANDSRELHRKSTLFAVRACVVHVCSVYTHRRTEPGQKTRKNVP